MKQIQTVIIHAGTNDCSIMKKDKSFDSSKPGLGTGFKRKSTMETFTVSGMSKTLRTLVDRINDNLPNLKKIKVTTVLPRFDFKTKFEDGDEVEAQEHSFNKTQILFFRKTLLRVILFNIALRKALQGDNCKFCTWYKKIEIIDTFKAFLDPNIIYDPDIYNEKKIEWGDDNGYMMRMLQKIGDDQVGLGYFSYDKLHLNFKGQRKFLDILKGLVGL